MNNSPKISVLMPVYNTKEEYLREAVESILNQSFPDFELLIIDDSSIDGIFNAVKFYKDNRVKYIKGKNQGLVSARNLGLELAKGELIANMDSDDISLPNRFQKQIDYLEQHREIDVLGSWFEIFPNKQIIKHPEFPKYIDFCKGCYIGNPTAIFRKFVFQKYNLKYDSSYKCEDYELWSRAIRFVKFANIQEVLLKYRWHENNSSKPTDAFLAESQRVQRNMLEFLTTDKQVQTQIKNIINSEQKEGILLPHSLGNLIGLFLSHQKKKDFKRKFVKSKGGN